MQKLPFRDNGGIAKYRHEVLAVVLRVNLETRLLEVLACRRDHEPFTGNWALPSGPVEADESMEDALSRYLAERVELTAVGHAEQLETFSDPGRDPFERTIATAYLGLVSVDARLELPPAVAWLSLSQLGEMAFDHHLVVAKGVHRLQAKISYTNIAFGLAPSRFVISELAAVYAGALGHDVDATNLARILQRRGQIVETGRVRTGDRGGRPAREYRFVDHKFVVTDPFATLRAPKSGL